MFKVHKGFCVNGHEGLIVVKAGYCQRCNHARKELRRAERNSRQEQLKEKELADTGMLIQLLDSIFSVVRRKMAANDEGVVACCTCDKLFHWKDVHCGHFVPREAKGLRWSTINTAPQCPGPECNGHPDGNQLKFGQYIDRVYGQGTAEELKRQRYEAFHVTREWLKEQIKIWRNKLNQLKYIQ